MRMIDADALKKYIDDCACCEKCQVKSCRCDEDCDFPGFLTAQWERAIDEQPTVDAVPVVRCKDCRYYYRNEHCIRYGDRFPTDKGYYCADAERKEE